MTSFCAHELGAVAAGDPVAGGLSVKKRPVMLCRMHPSPAKELLRRMSVGGGTPRCPAWLRPLRGHHAKGGVVVPARAARAVEREPDQERSEPKLLHALRNGPRNRTRPARLPRNGTVPHHRVGSSFVPCRTGQRPGRSRRCHTNPANTRSGRSPCRRLRWTRPPEKLVREPPSSTHLDMQALAVANASLQNSGVSFASIGSTFAHRHRSTCSSAGRRLYRLDRPDASSCAGTPVGCPRLRAGGRGRRLR